MTYELKQGQGGWAVYGNEKKLTKDHATKQEAVKEVSALKHLRQENEVNLLAAGRVEQD